MPGWWREDRLAEGCAYCGAEALTLDHVIPVSKGGETCPGNLVPACKTCNSQKRDNDPSLWIDKLDGRWLERLGVQPLRGMGALEHLGVV